MEFLQLTDANDGIIPLQFPVQKRQFFCTLHGRSTDHPVQRDKQSLQSYRDQESLKKNLNN